MGDLANNEVTVEALVAAFMRLRKGYGATDAKLRAETVLHGLRQVAASAISNDVASLATGAREVLREACHQAAYDSPLGYAARALDIDRTLRGNLTYRRTVGGLASSQSQIREREGFTDLAAVLLHAHGAGTMDRSEPNSFGATGPDSNTARVQAPLKPASANPGEPPFDSYSPPAEQAAQPVGPNGEIELAQLGQDFELFGIVRPTGERHPWGPRFTLTANERAIAVKKSGGAEGALVVATGPNGTRLLRAARDGALASWDRFTPAQASRADFLSGRRLGMIRVILCSGEILTTSFVGTAPHFAEVSE